MSEEYPLPEDGLPPYRPQPGPQWQFSETRADGVLFGGAAFGGKTFSMLLEAARGTWDPTYTAIIFRRMSTEITLPGALWDTAVDVYGRMGATPSRQQLTIRFPSGAAVRFGHLEHEDTCLDHKGAQYVFIGFDQLEMFSFRTFQYLLTRNRPPHGCTQIPYWRASANAEPGWLADMISWWWDPETGYPIMDRAGAIRHYVVEDDKLVWVPPEYRTAEGFPPKTFTFIPSFIADNPAGRAADPTYEANLAGKDRITRERLLKGNWLISEKGGMFLPQWLQVVDSVPEQLEEARYWDFAATEEDEKKAKDPDYTAGARGGIDSGVLYITDIQSGQWAPVTAERAVLSAASQDGTGVAIGWEEEKGSSGRYASLHFQQMLSEYMTYPDPVSGTKVERARPVASLAEQGRVKLLRGAWNKAFIAQASRFPFGKRDQVDSVSGLYKLLTTRKLVWAGYRPDTATYTVDWDALDKATVPWVSQWVDPVTLQTGVLCGIWQGKAGRMMVYREWMFPDPDPAVVVPVMSKAMLQLSEGAIRTLSGFQWYGSPAMFKHPTKVGTIARLPSDSDIVQAYSRRGINVAWNRQFDESGAIMVVARMARKRQGLILHSECKELLRQMCGWTVEQRKDPGGHIMARALINVASTLWESGQMINAPKRYPAYSPAHTRRLEEITEATRTGDLHKLLGDEYGGSAAPAGPSGWMV